MEFLYDYSGESNAPPHHATFQHLLRFAEDIRLVDNHAHPFIVPNAACGMGARPSSELPRLEELLTESTPIAPGAPCLTARHTHSHLRSVGDMHKLLSLEHVEGESWEDAETRVENARQNLGVWDLASTCVLGANVEVILFDDGLYAPANALPVPVSEIGTRLPLSAAHRVLRLETEAEAALGALIMANEHGAWKSGHATKLSDTYYADAFLDAFQTRIADPLPTGVVSYKTIAAYRTTLDIDLSHTRQTLNVALSHVLLSETSSTPRLQDKIIIDSLLRAAFEIANRLRLPVQVHCGFGDTDLDLPAANPCLLRRVVRAFPNMPLVLLHAAWPYAREAAYLAAAYPNVHVDFGLAVPLLSARGMLNAVGALLEVAPYDKVLYSSDAHSAPDVIFLAARSARRILAALFAQAVATGDMPLQKAERALAGILQRNARTLYNV